MGLLKRIKRLWQLSGTTDQNSRKVMKMDFSALPKVSTDGELTQAQVMELFKNIKPGATATLTPIGMDGKPRGQARVIELNPNEEEQGNDSGGSDGTSAQAA